ncbi:hypothetical protein CONPUDRAFT_143210 [Coniophora puteana RWD-64-598 SS2]|uniref:F-box domain-containing protein n=1 Tax=Coniophora puteana (strain RWD-64-598) TaxID=741705 RepID=A0A5M3MVT4_CONPW|nr:uncharacterized protein CONPUDRAFT_143210 [Coniophora puteana RWD-64-598 SS2]EIW83243.1 hypothetical protein CONPUDRAFT_143210 [Coniophora puteana RWD-64-598 SS2]
MEAVYIRFIDCQLLLTRFSAGRPRAAVLHPPLGIALLASASQGLAQFEDIKVRGGVPSTIPIFRARRPTQTSPAEVDGDLKLLEHLYKLVCLNPNLMPALLLPVHTGSLTEGAAGNARFSSQSTSSYSSCSPSTSKALRQEQQEVTALDHELASLQSELARVQALIQSRTANRTKLLSSISEKKALLRSRSPSELHSQSLPVDLPIELMHEIFRFCSLPSPSSTLSQPLTTPLLLGQVCRRWRAIAHSMSELWTALTVYDYGHWTPDTSVEMMRAWLRRSGTRPIRVHVKSTVSVRSEERAANFAVLQLLRAHMHRVRELSLNASWSYTQALLCGAGSSGSTAHALPALRNLFVDLDACVDAPEAVQHAVEISTSGVYALPSLTGVMLIGVPDTLVSAQPAFAHITELSLVLRDVNVLRVLAHCTALRRLELYARLDLRRQRSTVDQTDVLTHENLGCVTVHWAEDSPHWAASDQLAGLLRQLTLPALQAFQVCFPRLGDEGDLRHGKGGVRTYETDWRAMSLLSGLLGRSSRQLNEIFIKGFTPTGKLVADATSTCKVSVDQETDDVIPSVLFELAEREST